LRWPGTRRLLIQETSIIIFGGAYNVEPTVILPKTATSYTFTGLYPGNYYTFGIYAKKTSGNASTQVTLSNVRTLSDTTPPTTGPVVTVNEVGSNYAALS
jgi:hypothetical protein